MNKELFLQRLRELLTGMPAGEAEEAIRYYQDYFEDAGIENEQRVIEELVSPEQVARTIRESAGFSGNKEHSYSSSEFTDPFSTGAGTNTNTYSGTYTGANTNTYGGAYTGAGTNTGSYNNTYTGNYQPAGENNSSSQKSGSHTGWWILAICTCWLWLPILIGVLAAVFGILISLLAVLFGFGVAALALIFSAIVMVATSFTRLFTSPAAAILLMGGGLLVGALGILFGILSVSFFTDALPAIFRRIRRWRNKDMSKGGAAV